ncbi:hypothetical protein FFI97_023085 [Variovorax sp. KBS0712]|uniref:hypothetical protein n=1 Tax=Variovorax sp. KBS0712 TaxID=2578111 RepID=UPI001119E672|nr:hypothetical protein [Variovorax sp. KBS0712]TSD57041.1 hypothetical protein FFI97_023085 [Variovorax sp. KBS0712]
MGLLSDFFVANEGEAARYADRMSEDDQGKAIALQLRLAEYKGFTDLEVGTLWAILEGKEWDADLHELESDEGGDEGDSWLFRFPDRLVQLLAHVEHSALDAALPRWADTEELQVDVAELRPVVLDLQRLAKQAIAEQKSLYLWGSL